MTRAIAVKNPFSGKLERYDIEGLTPDELQAMPLDETVCDAVAEAIAPCLPEEFLAEYVLRVGVGKAGFTLIAAWLGLHARRLVIPDGDDAAPFGQELAAE